MSLAQFLHLKIISWSMPQLLDSGYGRNFWAMFQEMALPQAASSSRMSAVFTRWLDSRLLRDKARNNQKPWRCAELLQSIQEGISVKVLLRVESDGNPCFSSHIYQGSISDVAVVKASGLFTKLKRDSVVLADKGFKLVEFAKNFDVSWIVRPQFTVERK